MQHLFLVATQKKHKINFNDIFYLTHIFQNVIISTRVILHVLLSLKSAKSHVRLAIIAHLSLEQPHFQGSRATDPSGYHIWLRKSSYGCV